MSSYKGIPRSMVILVTSLRRISLLRNQCVNFLVDIDEMKIILGISEL